MRFKKNFTEEDYALYKSIYDRAEQSKGLSGYVQKQRDLELEALEDNPEIKQIKEYVGSLQTIEGEFMYEECKNGSITVSNEKFGIKGVRFNSNRQRLEIETDREMECYIYLQGKRNRKINTQHTRGYYSVFNIDEVAAIARFRRLYKCDGEIYTGKYICTLNYSCMYKDENNAMCMNEDKNNACGYRKLCEN